ncbi:hypothetical protein EYS14_10055 [Alteromonadaceae bacterium M269]|nr:hypothetical protein EYS14_10055 [Alteromonadaceae bacterium M269]
MADTDKQIFEQAVEQCQLKFDSYVESGTDEELFLSSYLCGHFDLVVGQAFINNQYSLEQLNTALLDSLKSAFEDDNMSAGEREQLLDLWQGLYRGLSE